MNVSKGETMEKWLVDGDERTSVVKYQNLINARSSNK